MKNYSHHGGQQAKKRKEDIESNTVFQDMLPAIYLFPLDLTSGGSHL